MKFQAIIPVLLSALASSTHAMYKSPFAEANEAPSTSNFPRPGSKENLLSAQPSIANRSPFAEFSKPSSLDSNFMLGSSFGSSIGSATSLRSGLPLMANALGGGRIPALRQVLKACKHLEKERWREFSHEIQTSDKVDLSDPRGFISKKCYTTLAKYGRYFPKSQTLVFNDVTFQMHNDPNDPINEWPRSRQQFIEDVFESITGMLTDPESPFLSFRVQLSQDSRVGNSKTIPVLDDERFASLLSSISMTSHSRPLSLRNLFITGLSTAYPKSIQALSELLRAGGDVIRYLSVTIEPSKSDVTALEPLRLALRSAPWLGDVNIRFSEARDAVNASVRHAFDTVLEERYGHRTLGTGMVSIKLSKSTPDASRQSSVNSGGSGGTSTGRRRLRL